MCKHAEILLVYIICHSMVRCSILPPFHIVALLQCVLLSHLFISLKICIEQCLSEDQLWKLLYLNEKIDATLVSVQYKTTARRWLA